MGFTLLYLSLIVLIPLGAAFLKTFTMSWSQFWGTVTGPRALASYRLSLGASLIGAAINTVMGMMVAGVLVRYRFPGKRILDALVDLPFALPTAVAGIALTAMFAPNGWVGRYLEPLGIKVAFTELGVVVALTFIGLPFVVRTVEPILQDLELEIEDHGTGMQHSTPRRGLGIVTMRERAALVGGMVEFTRPRDGGTLVRVRVPVAHPEPVDARV